jgi:hypothetical protein
MTNLISVEDRFQCLLIQLRSWAGGHQKAHPILFFKKKKRKQMIPFYSWFRPESVAILWGQPLKIPSNFIFQKKRKKKREKGFLKIIVFRP